MEIQILGSGTCIPSERRGSSGYLITLGSTQILFDCGNGVTWKLEKAGVNYLDIDHIFITHMHPDHNADLIPFLFATKYPSRTKRTKKLNLWGPPGFRNFINALQNVYGDWLNPQNTELSDLENQSYKFDDFDFSILKTGHTENSLAFRLESNGKSLVYSGDTDYFDSFIDFARGCDILLIECSLPDSLKRKGHLTPGDVIKISNLVRPKILILTHMYPVCDIENIFRQVSSETDCEVVLGEDSLKISI